MKPSRNAGIIDFAWHIPSLYVKLSDLEKFDDVSTGKYTIGLGQEGMAVCTDREDVHSLCLTVVDRLIRRAGISYNDIGRLDVGTETLLDSSKSVRTVIMQLFSESGNLNVEGADNVNACYGGTAALFNTVDWIDSPAWDGRYGLVVMADIAIYNDKAARPTGGAGALALLIGVDAPIVLESAYRATTAQHCYDFYKPSLKPGFPLVDGMLSIQCYLNSLTSCYNAFKKRLNKREESFAVDGCAFVAFHCPFCALVTKAYALLLANEEISSKGCVADDSNQVLFTASDLSNFATNKAMQKALMARYREQYKRQTEPTLSFSRNIGNAYTASLYFGLLSGLASCAKSEAAQLTGRRVLMFSYGSGFIASMFSFRLEGTGCKRLIDQAAVDVNSFQLHRVSITPAQMDKIHSHSPCSAPYVPKFPIDLLPGGCYYLQSIDERFRRSYERSPEQVPGKMDQVKAFIDVL